MARSIRGLAVLLLMILGLFLVPVVGSAGSVHPAAPHAQTAGFVITPKNPVPNGTTNSETPLIVATFSDSLGAVDPSSVLILVDGFNETGLQGYNVSSTQVSLQIQSILRLTNGAHNVSIFATDSTGATAQVSWNFTVNTSAVSTTPVISVSPNTILFDIGIIGLIAAAGAGGYILYLRRTRRFTFRKYFATHPVKKQYFTLYVPAIAAVLFIFIGLVYVSNIVNPPLLADEDVLVIGMFIGLTAYAFDARREMATIRAYERAFSQFLFEMADAMRGGIDPAKAIIELSKTYRNILQKPLRIAADSIRLGRRVEDVLREMAAPMKSPLITRYAGLIADATNVGGETSTVVYRAAKDMDDFIKIETERNKQLTLPVAVLYISFGVLMAVLFALLSIAPSLGSISFNLFSGGAGALSSGSGSAAVVVPKLSESTLEERFADLMIINGVGTGIIIGAFTEGKVKYGLLHSLALAAATLIAFFILYP
jgi:pilus assembly protein TadC